MNTQSNNTRLPKEIFESFWPLSNVRFGNILQQTGGRFTRELFTDEGTFVFKVPNPERTEEDVTRDTFPFNFLKTKNFPHLPALLQTNDGENYKNLDGKFIFIMEHIKGSKEGRQPEKWAQLAELAAELHNIPDYPIHSDITIPNELAFLEKRAKDLPFGNNTFKVGEGVMFHNYFIVALRNIEKNKALTTINDLGL